MKTVSSMPKKGGNNTPWDEVAASLKEGAVLKFTAPDDFDIGKQDTFRSILYTRLGQRAVRIKTTIRDGDVYVSAI